MNLVTPRYSFVRLQQTTDFNVCLDRDEPCIPSSSLFRLQFQFRLNNPTTTPEGKIRIMVATPLKVGYECEDVGDVAFLPGDYVGLNGIQLDPDSDTFFFSYYYNDLIDTTNPSLDFDDYNATVDPEFRINVGDCFRFQISEFFVSEELPHIPEIQGTFLGCTECFERVEDGCYTTLLAYYNQEDFNDFAYTEGNLPLVGRVGYNLLELPFYLKRPQINSEQEEYVQYDGNRIKLYERGEEEFEVQTDYLSYNQHVCLDIAFASDEVYIHNLFEQSLRKVLQNDTGSSGLILKKYSKKEKYEILWHEEVDSYGLAQGRTKLTNAKPFRMYQNNCKPSI